MKLSISPAWSIPGTRAIYNTRQNLSSVSCLTEIQALIKIPWKIFTTELLACFCFQWNIICMGISDHLKEILKAAALGWCWTGLPPCQQECRVEGRPGMAVEPPPPVLKASSIPEYGNTVLHIRKKAGLYFMSFQRGQRWMGTRTPPKAESHMVAGSVARGVPGNLPSSLLWWAQNPPSVSCQKGTFEEFCIHLKTCI